MDFVVSKILLAHGAPKLLKSCSFDPCLSVRSCKMSSGLLLSVANVMTNE